MFIYIHILSYYKLFLYFNVCLSVMWDSLSCSFTSIFFLTTSCHERLSNITLKTQIKVKEQFVVRKNMDVNEHERLSNITLKTQIKEKEL
jgi:hypothetical protein